MATITFELQDTGAYSIEELKTLLFKYAKKIVSTPKQDMSQFYGAMKLEKDAMQIQRELRSEWNLVNAKCVIRN